MFGLAHKSYVSLFSIKAFQKSIIVDSNVKMSPFFLKKQHEPLDALKLGQPRLSLN
jgi:hypothetical protein